MKKCEEHSEKAHAKDPDNYSRARIKIYAPDEANLHEITLTCIKVLDSNGSWDFEIAHSDKDNMNIVAFKYNGTITAVTALSKLNFHCEHQIKWEFADSLFPENFRT